MATANIATTTNHNRHYERWCSRDPVRPTATTDLVWPWWFTRSILTGVTLKCLITLDVRSLVCQLLHIITNRYIIKDVRYVEGLGYNMFSSSQFCDNGYWVKQFQYGSDVNDEDNNVILSARRNGNLYSTVFRSIPQTYP
ncbi:hypothetical protein OSB04_025408 [Centaurea solstitialis]|uniref:Uncharacterized protein n=1 Tax=Centaurea solstitialis TaxID=347529 RepID=A0AA38T1F0_9ASTR|nr:hypothetical protein OSB04_025408 [Centaurea solstitialis]